MAEEVSVLEGSHKKYVLNVELAVRFGKALVVHDLNEIDPFLVPVMRADKVRQGPQFVVQVRS